MSRRQTPTKENNNNEPGGSKKVFDKKLTAAVCAASLALIGVLVVAGTNLSGQKADLTADNGSGNTVSSAEAVSDTTSVPGDTDVSSDAVVSSASSSSASASSSSGSNSSRMADEKKSLNASAIGKEDRGYKKTTAQTEVVYTETPAEEKKDSKKDKKSSDTDKSTDTSTDTANDTDSEPEAPAHIKNHGVDFTQLWSINTDIYAWIYIPNTNIDYPILQCEGDDSFYLEHNYRGQYEFAGSIYTEDINAKDFSDPNTVVYGHNMLNGSMFRTLHNFRDPAFFECNPYIYVYLPDRTLTYEIFSGYEYDNRHILSSFDFNDRDVYEKYLEYAMNPTEAMMCVRRDLEVTPDDRIITLSTCLGNIETSRYLVQGVLISDEPAEDTDR